MADDQMVEVDLLVSRAGTGFTQNRGERVRVPQSEAVRMIADGQAIPVRAARVEKTSRRKKDGK